MLSADDLPEPLAGQPALRTHDVDEAQQVVSSVYVPHQLRASAGLEARLNLLQSPRLTFGYLTYGTEAQLDVPPMLSCYHVNLTLRGHTSVRHGNVHVETSAGSSGAALSPQADSVVRWSADAAQFAVKIPVPTLVDQLSALLHEHVCELPRLEPEIDLSVAASTGILPAARFFAAQSGIGPQLGELVQRQTESYFLTQLLLGIRHTYSDRLTRGCGATGRRAFEEVLDYVEAYPDRVLGLAELAAVAGTTGTALQAAFENELGLTVETFVRGVRLTRVHAEVRASGGVDLAALARRWGFTGVSHLRAAYRAQYRQELGQSAGSWE